MEQIDIVKSPIFLEKIAAFIHLIQSSKQKQNFSMFFQRLV